MYTEGKNNYYLGNHGTVFTVLETWYHVDIIDIIDIIKKNLKHMLEFDKKLP